MEKEIKPPIAKIKTKEIIYHNETYLDDYAWLREKESSEVIDYLKAENEYTDQITSHLKDLREQVYQEMVAKIKETDTSEATKVDNYFYYTRTEEGKQYPIYCRKKDSLDNSEELLLDCNDLSTKTEYFELGVFKVSPNHQYLAYSVDIDGSEEFIIYIMDLSTGELLKDQIKNTSYTLQWMNDSKSFFFTTLDEAKRPYKIYHHILGNLEDKLIFHDKDEAFFLSLSKTNSKKYILINAFSQTTSEVLYLDADNYNGVKLFNPRKNSIEYSVDHHSDNFYIMSNIDATNFKVSVTDIDKTSQDNWTDIIPENESKKLDGIDLFQNYLIVYERENGLKNIKVINLNNKTEYYVDFPESVYDVSPGSNPNFETQKLRFYYTSLITPETVYDYDLETREKTLVKEYEVLGGYDKSNYVTERIFATSEDGTQVPISLVYKKSVGDLPRPLYLYGYGSYEISKDTEFSRNKLSLIDRGFIYAIAHIRGGGSLGRKWYKNGKFLKKKNTFKDYIACAEHLIKENYTTSEKLVAYGGSAGGMLMGAVANMRPDLFKVVVADVPFVDVINTMMDDTLPLTVVEYDEWGNPNEKEYFDYMMSYSPYDNVEKKDYPNMLVVAGLNDPRVGYWEPAKLVAKLRKYKTDNNLLLLKTDMDSGHSGPSGRYDFLKDIAFEFSFLIDLVK